MPRRRWVAPLSSYDVPKVDPNDRNAMEDSDLVRHALVDFEDELAALSDETREKMVEDLVDAVRFARGGVKASKRGVSNKALAQQIFLSDVGRALERAGLPAKRWRKQYDNDGGESFFFRLARDVAEVSGITLPKDLKLPAKRADQHEYGIMSRSMKVEQEDELVARAKRSGKP
jgi:hypothetical protein